MFVEVCKTIEKLVTKKITEVVIPRIRSGLVFVVNWDTTYGMKTPMSSYDIDIGSCVEIR